MNNHSTFQIAIVEDDKILREELAFFISRQGFIVHQANNSQALKDILLIYKIDLIVLDLNLPGQSGIEIAKEIRNTSKSVGIIMLTARTSSQDKIIGYEVGADIYLPKPTPLPELLAAVMTLKRRITKDGQEIWKLNANKRLLIVNTDVSIPLTATESALLMAFANTPGRILETGVIFDVLSEHSSENEVTKRAVENIISRLRKKINESTISNQGETIIKSVWGRGYQLCIELEVF